MKIRQSKTNKPPDKFWFVFISFIFKERIYQQYNPQNIRSIYTHNGIDRKINLSYNDKIQQYTYESYKTHSTEKNQIQFMHLNTPIAIRWPVSYLYYITFHLRSQYTNHTFAAWLCRKQDKTNLRIFHYSIFYIFSIHHRFFHFICRRLHWKVCAK